MSDVDWGPVRLQYRHVPLSEGVVVQAAGDGVFAPVESPPPVHTILRAVAADGTVRALEVTRVVEVADADPHGACGLYARLVDEDALARMDMVGSEHLSSSPPQERLAAAEDSDASDGSDVGNAAVAMPAPVLVDSADDESSDDVEAGDDPGDFSGDDVDVNDDAGEAIAGSEDAGETVAATEDAGEAAPDDAPRRGRKRRSKKSRK